MSSSRFAQRREAQKRSLLGELITRELGVQARCCFSLLHAFYTASSTRCHSNCDPELIFLHGAQHQCSSHLYLMPSPDRCPQPGDENFVIAERFCLESLTYHRFGDTSPTDVEVAYRE